MMNYLSGNIKYLRRVSQLTQSSLADKLQIKRSLIGAYEEGRATPKIAVLQEMAAAFQLSLDQLIGHDFESCGLPRNDGEQGQFRVMPIVVDQDNEELIPIVPVKASAGYMNGFADPEYIGQLPRFSMPVPELSVGKTYRVFQLEGDSMMPIISGSYMFCEFVESIRDLRDGQTYVLITKDEGLVYKRVYLKGNNQFLLKSDNSEYTPYQIEGASVLELWKARGVLSFELPKSNQTELSQISDTLSEMKEEIRRLRDA